MGKKKIVGEDGKQYVVKEKKPFYKRVWFWILAVVVILIAIDSLGGNDDKSTSSNKTNNASSQKAASSTSAKAKTETKKEETYSMNQDVKVGDMVYNVSSKEVAKQVGPSVFPTDAKDTFLVVTLTVTNKGNEAVTVDSSFFKLKEGDKTFDADASASMSANQDESGQITNSFFLQKLNPDVSLSGKIVFDVSESQANSANNMLQVQTGAFGTQTSIINLK